MDLDGALEHQQEFFARVRKYRRGVGKFARRMHHEGLHRLDLAASGQRLVMVLRAQPPALQCLAIGHAHHADHFVLRGVIRAHQLRHAHAIGFGQAQHRRNRRFAQAALKFGQIAFGQPGALRKLFQGQGLLTAQGA
ncbi:hypothetical protein D3C85_750140 [compost metagenome]